MADQLFYSYTSDGTLSDALASSHEHPYSIVFDKKRSSILVDRNEFGQGVISAAYHYTPESMNTINWANGDPTIPGIPIIYANFGSTQLISGIDLFVDERGHCTGGALSKKTLRHISYMQAVKLYVVDSDEGTDILLGYSCGNGNGDPNVGSIYQVVSSTIPVASSNSYGVIKIGFGPDLVGINSDGQLTYKATVETPLSLGTGTGSGSIITALSVSGHTITASYISVDDLTGGGADHFQSASFTSGLKISTHQENGVNSGTGHLYVPVATTSQYGVAKVGSGSGKVGISSGVLTYEAAKTGALKYKVNGTEYSTGFNANSASAVNEFNLKSGTHVTVTYSDSGDITFDTTGVITSETPLSLGTGTGSGSIITSLSVSGHTITASYISVDDLTGGGADHFQSADYSSGLKISTHQENGVNSGTGHLYVPVATTSQYGVAKIGSGSGLVGINSSNVLTYATAKSGALKYKVNGTEYSTGFNANSSSAVNEFNLKSGTHVTVTYGSSGEITFDTTGVITSETQLSLGTGTGSGSIITALSVSGHTITASYISVDDLTGGGADHFQSASFTSGLQISTHQENGLDSGTGHLFVPVATASRYGVMKPLYVNSTYTSSNLLRKNSASRNYAVGLTSDGFAYVNVPWSNTHNSHGLTVTNGTASLITSTGEITFVESTSGCSATTGSLTATTTRKKIVIGSGSNLVGIDSSGQLTYTNTDYQCTSSGHYSPTANNNYNLSATAASGKAIASITLKRDSKGHVTAIDKTEVTVGTGGENCVTYTSESNGIHQITVATAPGTEANTLYIVL